MHQHQQQQDAHAIIKRLRLSIVERDRRIQGLGAELTAQSEALRLCRLQLVGLYNASSANSNAALYHGAMASPQQQQMAPPHSLLPEGTNASSPSFQQRGPSVVSAITVDTYHNNDDADGGRDDSSSRIQWSSSPQRAPRGGGGDVGGGGGGGATPSSSSSTLALRNAILEQQAASDAAKIKLLEAQIMALYDEKVAVDTEERESAAAASSAVRAAEEALASTQRQLGTTQANNSALRHWIDTGVLVMRAHEHVLTVLYDEGEDYNVLLWMECAARKRIAAAEEEVAAKQREQQQQQQQQQQAHLVASGNSVSGGGASPRHQRRVTMSRYVDEVDADDAVTMEVHLSENGDDDDGMHHHHGGGGGAAQDGPHRSFSSTSVSSASTSGTVPPRSPLLQSPPPPPPSSSYAIGGPVPSAGATSHAGDGDGGLPSLGRQQQQRLAPPPPLPSAAPIALASSVPTSAPNASPPQPQSPATTTTTSGSSGRTPAEVHNLRAKVLALEGSNGSLNELLDASQLQVARLTEALLLAKGGGGGDATGVGRASSPSLAVGDRSVSGLHRRAPSPPGAGEGAGGSGRSGSTVAFRSTSSNAVLSAAPIGHSPYASSGPSSLIGSYATSGPPPLPPRGSNGGSRASSPPNFLALVEAAGLSSPSAMAAGIGGGLYGGGPTTSLLLDGVSPIRAVSPPSASTASAGGGVVYQNRSTVSGAPIITVVPSPPRPAPPPPTAATAPTPYQLVASEEYIAAGTVAAVGHRAAFIGTTAATATDAAGILQHSRQRDAATTIAGSISKRIQSPQPFANTGSLSAAAMLGTNAGAGHFSYVPAAAAVADLVEHQSIYQSSAAAANALGAAHLSILEQRLSAKEEALEETLGKARMTARRLREQELIQQRRSDKMRYLYAEAAGAVGQLAAQQQHGHTAANRSRSANASRVTSAAASRSNSVASTAAAADRSAAAAASLTAGISYGSSPLRRMAYLEQQQRHREHTAQSFITRTTADRAPTRLGMTTGPLQYNIPPLPAQSVHMSAAAGSSSRSGSAVARRAAAAGIHSAVGASRRAAPPIPAANSRLYRDATEGMAF